MRTITFQNRTAKPSFNRIMMRTINKIQNRTAKPSFKIKESTRSSGFNRTMMKTINKFQNRNAKLSFNRIMMKTITLQKCTMKILYLTTKSPQIDLSSNII